MEPNFSALVVGGDDGRRNDDEIADLPVARRHLYARGEIESLIAEHCADLLEVVDASYDRENWAILCVKRSRVASVC